jgi:hypothetical protein
MPPKHQNPVAEKKDRLAMIEQVQAMISKGSLAV